MGLTFHGTIDALREIVAETGAQGAWRRLPDGAHQFRATSGAIVNWWPSTGTVLMQGAPEPARELAAFLGPALAPPSSRQGEMFG